MARFMRKGITKFFFAPSIASATLVPTATEVNAGTNLTTHLCEVSGFTFASNPVDTPDMVNTFVTTVPGEDKTEDSSLTFYEDRTSNPIFTAQAKGTSGYIVIFYTGIAGASPAAADKCDVWPVDVGSIARQYTADNEAAKYMVAYNPTAVPGFTKTLT